jgi:glycosyltransferase involved in cell wall biosynthesis
VDAPPDLIHLHELFRPPHLVLAPWLRTTPYVVSLHGATSPANLARYRERKSLYGRLVERRLVAGAGVVLALTPGERAEAHRWHPGLPPVRVAANVADGGLLAAPGWHPPTPGPEGATEVVTLARWDVHHKGLGRLAELATGVPEVRFTVHGRPCGNEPERLAELRATAPPNLVLAPPVLGDAKVDALRGARAFVLLSRWEGLAMAMLEAMALGVPCIVSSEVAATLGTAPPVITLPQEPGLAVDALRRVLADDGRLHATGRAGRAWARSHAAPAVVAEEVASAYREVLARSSTPSRTEART